MSNGRDYGFVANAVVDVVNTIEALLFVFAVIWSISWGVGLLNVTIKPNVSNVPPSHFMFGKDPDSPEWYTTDENPTTTIGGRKASELR